MAFHGMRVTPGDRLFEIADLSRVWVLADVYEQDLAAVRLGMPGARQPCPTCPGARGRARSPSSPRPSRRRRARSRCGSRSTNADGALEARHVRRRAPCATATAARRLAVPESAVIDTGERTLVFVDRGEGRFEPREVVARGARRRGGFEVRRGPRGGRAGGGLRQLPPRLRVEPARGASRPRRAARRSTEP